MTLSNDTSIADRILPTPPSVASKKLGRQKRLEDRMSINYDALCDIHIGDIDLTEETMDQDVATKHEIVVPDTAPACAGVEFGNLEEEDPTFAVSAEVHILEFDDADCDYLLSHVA